MMKYNILFLLIIIVAAFLVRAVGIQYGLPFLYHDDEPIIVNYALAYGAGDFNPHAFRMSPLLSYILFFIYGIFFTIGFAMRVFHSIKDFAYLFLNDPTIFYLIARAVFGILCGTISVVIVYILGKRYFDKRVALIASFFLAFAYLHVRDSHYAYFDVPLTLCIILFFIKAQTLFCPARRLDYIQLGALMGLAMSVKYSGALLVLPFFLAMLYNAIRFRRPHIISATPDIFLSGIFCFAVFFICNPFSIFSFREFARDLSKMPYIPAPPNFHFKVSLANGVGVPLIAFAIFGIILSFIKKNVRQLFLVSYIIFYYWVINSGSGQPGERIVIPLIPFVAVFSAYSVSFLGSIIERNASQRTSLVAMTIIAILLISPSVERIYYSDKLFLKEDTRTQAYMWIKDHIQKDSRIALDATTSCFPRLERDIEQIKEISGHTGSPQFAKPKGADSLKMKFLLQNPHYQEKTYYIFYLKESPGQGFLSSYPDLSVDFSSIKDNRIRYIVLSYILIDDRVKAFVGEVKKRCKLLKSFSPYREGVDRLRPKEVYPSPAAAFMLEELKDRASYGPVIKIYEVD